MRLSLILLLMLLPGAMLNAQQQSATQSQPQTTRSGQPSKPIKVQATQPVQTITSNKPEPSTRLGSPAGAADQPALSKEQQAKQDALMEANPELKKAVQDLEARGGKVKSWGNTDAAGMAAAGAKPSLRSATGGNKSAAAAAYKRKDYQAALQHYKALAAEGDTEAAVMLGIMHEKGEGVDEDPAAAYAWYGRAADQGDPVAREIVRDMNDKDQIKDSDLDAAGQKYEEIARELDEPASAEHAGERFEALRKETGVNTEIYERSSGRE
jgi:TPR repeat protein